MQAPAPPREGAGTEFGGSSGRPAGSSLQVAGARRGPLQTAFSGPPPLANGGGTGAGAASSWSPESSPRPEEDGQWEDDEGEGQGEEQGYSDDEGSDEDDALVPQIAGYSELRDAVSTMALTLRRSGTLAERQKRIGELGPEILQAAHNGWDKSYLDGDSVNFREKSLSDALEALSLPAECCQQPALAAATKRADRAGQSGDCGGEAQEGRAARDGAEWRDARVRLHRAEIDEEAQAKRLRGV
jgi:hypothetical protein